MSQERLVLLQSLCGLSNPEAAQLCGVSERAWNGFRTEGASPRHWEQLLTPLENLRDQMNEVIDRGYTAIRAQIAAAPDGAEIKPPVFLIYMRNDEMLPDEAWPFASVQRRVTAELIETLDLQAEPVIFDRFAYSGFRRQRPDTRAERLDWALNLAEKSGLRFSFKVGARPNSGRDGETSIGWAVFRTAKPRMDGGEI